MGAQGEDPVLGELSFFLLALCGPASAADLRLQAGGLGTARSVIAMGVAAGGTPEDV